MQRDSLGKWVMIIALVMIVGAGIWMAVSINKRRIPVTLGDQRLQARIADNETLRKQGLSGTKQLGDREAMLFVFETAGRWGIWMKDMNYSLDIAWLDDNKKIVYTAQQVSPDTYPTIFLPDKEARYIIELPAGYLEAHHIGRGQIVGFAL